MTAITHEQHHREVAKEKGKRLSLVASIERRGHGILKTSVTFGGAVIGGVMQGLSKSPHGPKIGPVPAELAIGGGLLGLSLVLTPSGEKGEHSPFAYLGALGKGIGYAWGVDFGHAVGQRKRDTGSFFDSHGTKTIASGVPNPQAMADQLIRQAGG
jgi:hypothetical protein